MAQMKKEEIGALIAEAQQWCQQANSVLDLNTWDTKSLVYSIAMTGVWTIGVLARAIDEQEVPHLKIVRRCYALIEAEPKWRLLQIASERYRAPALILLYYRLVLLDTLTFAIYRRIPGPIGRELMNVSKSDDKPLLRALSINNLRDFKAPESEKSHDLRYDLALKFHEKFEEMRKAAASNVSMVRVAVVLGGPPELYCPPWLDWESIQAGILLKTQVFFDAIFSGEVERLPKALRDSYRESFRTRDRRETILRGADTEIQSEITGDSPTPEGSIIEREIESDAYEYAKSRYGEQGSLFLDKLIASGGNVTIASEATGFSRATGHKIKKELQIHISKKNPIK